VKEILDLIDQAIVNCPLESRLELAMMYSLRSATLAEQNELDLAMVNIERAIELAPNELLYQIYKIKHLLSANRRHEALDCDYAICAL